MKNIDQGWNVRIIDQEKDQDQKVDPDLKAKVEIDKIEADIEVDRVTMKYQDTDIIQGLVIDQNPL